MGKNARMLPPGNGGEWNILFTFIQADKGWMELPCPACSNTLHVIQVVAAVRCILVPAIHRVQKLIDCHCVALAVFGSCKALAQLAAIQCCDCVDNQLPSGAW